MWIRNLCFHQYAKVEFLVKSYRKKSQGSAIFLAKNMMKN